MGRMWRVILQILLSMQGFGCLRTISQQKKSALLFINGKSYRIERKSIATNVPYSRNLFKLALFFNFGS
jgi:hypothetical protein